VAHILVVDDEDLMQQMLRDIIQDAGHEVSVASDGREGLAVLEEKPADLVITDILMPEQDGLELIRILHRHHPEVKIIAISGGGITVKLNFLPEAEELGAHDTLHKPFGRSELLLKIDGLLESAG
jgi:DNA-binding response OmpR family regulator